MAEKINLEGVIPEDIEGLPREKIEALIEGVPDVNDPDRINYSVSVGDYTVYLEGWCDKCLAGTGFPSMERGGIFEKLNYMQDLTVEILPRIGKEKGLELIAGGFVEREEATRLYGVTYGIYRKGAR